MRVLAFAKFAAVALSLLLPTSGSAQPSYDLTGTWLLIGNDVQQSFCGDPSSQELVLALATLAQDGESVTMNIPGENAFTGRTSNFFVAAEDLSAEASTVFTGTVSNNASIITAALVFFDKHPCPDAETGQTRLLMIRLGS